MHYARLRTTGQLGTVDAQRSPVVGRLCSIDGCLRPHRSNGLCGMHHERVRKTGDPGSVGVSRTAPGSCVISGCERTHAARGYCMHHYQKWRFGLPMAHEGSSTTTPERKLCSVAGCNRDLGARGLCRRHYRRVLAHGDPETVLRGPETVCSVDGCHRHRAARGLCSMHIQRLLATGEPGEAAPLYDGRSVNTDRYIALARDGKQVLEHRVVMEDLLGRPLRATENVHHRNGVRIDNRPENLELWATAHPYGQRVDDLVAWVVAQYPSEIAAHASPPSLSSRDLGAGREDRGPMRITSDGYVAFYRDGKRGFEHRAVFEAFLERPLRRFEHVHHRNGIRFDNCLSNLELWVTPHPHGQRVSDLVAWVVATYPLQLGAES